MSEDTKLRKLLSNLDSDDVKTLKQLAIERWGLVNTECRQVIWPKMYGITRENIPPKPEAKKLKQHKDYDQVVLDVKRTLKRFPPGMDEDVRMSMQDQLVDLIMRVLVRNKDLHYYQGFHDVCVTFLLVLDEDMAFGLMDKLSREHFRLFMGPDMSETAEHLQLIHILLSHANKKLTDLFDEHCLQPLYALSWVITWFGHVLGELSGILRVYDFFLGSDHPSMPLYLSAALVLHRTEAVLSCEPDFALLHQCLGTLPSETLPLEDLISSACQLYLHYPPAMLEKEASPRPSIATLKSNGRAIGVRAVGVRLKSFGQVLASRSLVVSVVVLLLAILVAFLARYLW